MGSFWCPHSSGTSFPFCLSLLVRPLSRTSGRVDARSPSGSASQQLEVRLRDATAESELLIKFARFFPLKQAPYDKQLTWSSLLRFSASFW